MILDHNTTASVAWNSSGNNADGMNEVKTALESDTSNWKETARLITADEIANITGAKDALDWTSDKIYAIPPVKGTSILYYYFDGADGTDTTWQTQVVTTKGASKYAWLYDYTNGCTSYGCNTDDPSNYGYWTSTPAVGAFRSAWSVFRHGGLNINIIGTDSSHCVRPVITIKKSELKLKENTEFVYNYTGKEQNFITPVDGKYKIELWGAQGGNTILKSYGGTGGKGAYTSGIITLNKNKSIYILEEKELM